MAGWIRDSVPAEPIRRLILEWIALEDPPNTNDHCMAPIAMLAARVGVHDSTVRMLIQGRRSTVAFDLADRYLCAIGCEQAWRHEPELRRHYRKACKGADRIRPLRRPL